LERQTSFRRRRPSNHRSRTALASWFNQPLDCAATHTSIPPARRYYFLDWGEALGPVDAGLSPCQHLTARGVSAAAAPHSAPLGSPRGVAGSRDLCTSSCPGGIRGVDRRTKKHAVRDFLFRMHFGVSEF